MKVKEVMIPTSVACYRGAKLREACGALLASKWGFLPVVAEDGKFCGALTEEDLREALNGEGVSIYEMTVGESASQDSISCSPEDTLYDTLLCMYETNVR
jgi:CBS domain-containing protein